MTLIDVIKCARDVDKYNITTQRSNLFGGIGLTDPYSVDKIGTIGFHGAERLSDIRSANVHSLVQYTKRVTFDYDDGIEKHCDIYQSVVITGNDVDEPRYQSEEQREALGEVRAVLRDNGLEDNDFSFVRQFFNEKTHITSYSITVLATNLCHARYLLAKELSQIITKMCGGLSSAREMLEQALNCLNDIKRDRELDSEAVGIFHAIEVMLPWRLHNDFDGIVDDDQIVNDEKRNLMLAQRFMVPKFVIDVIRREFKSLKGNYRGFSHSENTYFDQTEGRYY